MGELLTKLKALKSSLSEAEQKMVQYIIDHPDTFPYSSVSELAEAGKVSVATVSRLPRKLEFSNLRDLKIAIARETQPTYIDAIYESVEPKDSDEDIVNKVFAGNQASIRDTLSLLNIPDLIRCAKKANAASRLIFIGIGLIN